MIKEIWDDYFDRNSEFEVFLVAPEPPIPFTRGTVGILLIVQHPHRGLAAAMTTVSVDDIAGQRLEESAHSFETQVPFQQVLRQARILTDCLDIQRQGHGQCILRVGERILPPDQHIRIHDGLGLVIEVPMVIDDARWHNIVLPRWREAGLPSPPQPQADPAVDENSLMARRPQARRSPSSDFSSTHSSVNTETDETMTEYSSDDEWRRAVVYTLDGQSRSALLPWREGEELFQRVALAFDIEATTILQLHHIGFRPPDLEQVDLQGLLLQRLHEPRAAPNLQLILLDLEIHDDDEILPGIFRRKAYWAPRITTILTLFRFLGIENFFHHHQSRCHMWHNNGHVDITSTHPLHIADGEYVEISIGDIDCHETLPAERDEHSLFSLDRGKSHRITEAH